MSLKITIFVAQKQTTMTTYIPDAEPDRHSKTRNWQAAKGLQAVDGLQTSAYLDHISGENIAGRISAYEASELIDSYYEATEDLQLMQQHEEADKVAARINVLLSETGFTLSLHELQSIHKRLFEGLLPSAGEIRTRNFIKHEWVLDGDSVTYGNAYGLADYVENLIRVESFAPYRSMNEDEMVGHFARFVSRIWQAHPFSEGNTRTTAVFAIKYLRTMGFDVDNSLFENHSRFFRDALVRANYKNLRKGVFEDNRPLYSFFEDLLLGAAHPLKSRQLHIRADNKDLTLSYAEEIRRLIESKPDITRKAMADHLGISVKTIERQLKKMPDIHYVGPAKGGHWIVEG